MRKNLAIRKGDRHVRWLYIPRSIGSREIRVNGARASNQAGIRVHHFLDDYFGSSFTGSCYQSKIIIFFVNIAPDRAKSSRRVYVCRARTCAARAPLVYRLSFFTRPDYLLRPWLSSMIIAPIDHQHPTFRASSFAILISRPPNADTGHTFNCQLSIINHLNTTLQIFLPHYFPHPHPFSRHSSFIPLPLLYFSSTFLPSDMCLVIFNFPAIYRSFHMYRIFNFLWQIYENIVCPSSSIPKNHQLLVMYKNGKNDSNYCNTLSERRKSWNINFVFPIINKDSSYSRFYSSFRSVTLTNVTRCFLSDLNIARTTSGRHWFQFRMYAPLLGNNSRRIARPLGSIVTARAHTHTHTWQHGDTLQLWQVCTKSDESKGLKEEIGLAGWAFPRGQ